MKPSRTPLPSSTQSHSRAGFTLIEVTLSLAIVSIGLVALLGMFPAGMRTSREAVDATIVTHILSSVRERLKDQPLQEGIAAISPAFFDADGAYLSPENEALTPKRMYRAEVEIRPWQQAPEGTSSLRPVKISLFWPLDRATGEPLGPRSPKVEALTAVSALTGPRWQQIDPQYVPTIEF